LIGSDQLIAGEQPIRGNIASTRTDRDPRAHAGVGRCASADSAPKNAGASWRALCTGSARG